ncbi:terpenoid cyclases/Protein prenyltransferase [Coemansia reversa NRRL 1564]|uniref:Terpenoid cyclases/Protein prenyltransferase n=1 Tax=Coemansia reversa (strain ATCC 12441 / NRRL 1564) TaxID=763665 RepID=A0A2G5BBC4_COERN|nr:terpenoid cyclases/Protein prenyltransferase [Coemansia reversa NRRL 1564]|eukprot:PIA16318.1 terpenoid cyclases/Protein prenyltransferase [Coemansia reversa NRRL 1564]
MATAELAVDAHVRYFRHCLNMLPAETVSLDATRMTIAQLSLVGLAALGRLEESIPAKQREDMIEWIYAQQIPSGRAEYRGFRGGSLFGPHERCNYPAANCGNVAATYSALCALLLLGDDLARVDRAATIAGIGRLQQESGTFAPHPGTTERDPRFIYCACAVSAILDDWSGVDIDAATKYILSCCCYDGGISQIPFQESHGGLLYCCVASLALMGRLDSLPDRHRTLQWALFRQCGGYQGRINKTADVCYSFWVGASVELLGGRDLVDVSALVSFIQSCETDIGGLSKWPGYRPDPLHSALGIVGFSLCRPDALPRMSPELLLPKTVVERLLRLGFRRSHKLCADA